MATESGFSACRAPIGHLAASAAAARSESVRQRIAARRRRRAPNFRRARECGVSSAVRVAHRGTVTPIGLFWVRLFG